LTVRRRGRGKKGQAGRPNFRGERRGKEKGGKKEREKKGTVVKTGEERKTRRKNERGEDAGLKTAPFPPLTSEEKKIIIDERVPHLIAFISLP